MARRFISQFGHQDPIDEVFLAAEKQLRPNRNGNLYLQVELRDRSGAIAARMWNATEDDYRRFENGDYVHVVGTTQVFQGAMQMIVTHIEPVPSEEVDERDFSLLTSACVDHLAAELAQMLRGMANPHLRSLAECFLVDETFMRKFTTAPAGVKNHHAYRGGLLEHVVGLMHLVRRVADCYPVIDADLLLMGAFVHDMAKIDELSYERELAYTDEGQLIGHVVMAVSMIDEKAREAQQLAGEPLPSELLLRLKHMVVSHHGQYEFGSPKLPMTLEAVALHQLDNLDAKVHTFSQLMRDDPNHECPWTAYNHTLGRKLYKGDRNVEFAEGPATSTAAGAEPDSRNHTPGAAGAGGSGRGASVTAAAGS